MTNFVFFGSSEYSLIILKKILEIKDFNLLAVVTKPDKAVGRKQNITANPVADFSRQNNLNLLQPNDFDQSFKSQIKKMTADLYLVVAFGPPFFDQELIDLPKFKIVNIHPSSLPKYRGATPGPWQIINGETSSAVSFFQIDSLPDHGPIIAQLPFRLSPTETSVSFYQKAFTLATQNLEVVIKNYLSDPTNITSQNHLKRSYFPKFTKDDAQINWSWDIVKIERFVRALNPWPVAWTYINTQQFQKLKMKIISSKITNQQLLPILVQIEGKKTTNWSEIEKYYTIIKS